MQTRTDFPYRILIVDDAPTLRALGKMMLETQGYEVLCAEDGFGGLAALKQSLPDMIISDLHMPNMNGFEFLFVVRRRFPDIPVVVISGEFSGLSVPETVLADAFFPKSGYQSAALFETIGALLQDLPTRPRNNRRNEAAVWLNNDAGEVAITCPACLRTFPVSAVQRGSNNANCAFCTSTVRFNVMGEKSSASGESATSA